MTEGKPSAERDDKGRWEAGGGSPNPGGQPKWVKAARDAMRDELWPLAQRHLLRVLGGQRPADSTQEEDALYAGVTLKDRNTAASIVAEYALPKPKATTRLEGKGADGAVTVQVVTLAEEQKP